MKGHLVCPHCGTAIESTREPAPKRPAGAPSSFVERERASAMQAVADAFATAARAYQAALTHDGLPLDTTLAVFSPDNPFVPFYERAYQQALEWMSQAGVHGYVGLQIGSRDLYKPAREGGGRRRRRSTDPTTNRKSVQIAQARQTDSDAAP